MNIFRKLACALSLSLIMPIGLISAAAQEASSAGNANSQSSQSNSNKLGSGGDQRFLKEAAAGGLAEVELGQLAVQKASIGEVRKFGQRMVDDHSKANDQLKQVANNKGLTLPTELTAKDKSLKDRLAKLSGDDFDKAYMAAMVKDHKKDVADFEKESRSGKDPEVKDFATRTLPTLQDHLKEAQRVAPMQSASTDSRAANSAQK